MMEDRIDLNIYESPGQTPLAIFPWVQVDHFVFYYQTIIFIILPDSLFLLLKFNNLEEIKDYVNIALKYIILIN